MIRAHSKQTVMNFILSNHTGVVPQINVSLLRLLLKINNSIFKPPYYQLGIINIKIIYYFKL